MTPSASQTTDGTAGPGESYDAVLRRSFGWRYEKRQDVWTHEDALHRIGDLAAEMLDRSGGRRVLDIGIGNGSAAPAILARPERRLTGLDIVTPSEWPALSARYGDRITLVESGFLDWEGEEGAFDLIVDMGCFHHQAKDDHGPYLAKAQRLLAEDGLLLLCVYGQNEDADEAVRQDETDHGRLSFHYTPHALERQLRAAGFEWREMHRIARASVGDHYLVAVAAPC